MPNPLEPFLSAQRALILDGALATELERRGADLRDPLWSARLLLDDPALIRAVHADYFLAGADVATTATYQASVAGFGRRGIDAPAAVRLMQGAVTLAIEAREAFWSVPAHREGRLRPLIAASVGPYGAMLADGSEYRGGYTVADAALREFHRPRIDALAVAGADLLACETFPCLREALIVAELLERHPTLCAWVSFSCRDGRHTSEGEDIGACAAALRPRAQIVALGVNCTPPAHLGSLLTRMRAGTDRPLVAYPNSGEIYDAPSHAWHGAACRSFAQLSDEWVAAGARLIGGCCRTTPADIRALRVRHAGAPR